MAVTTTTPYAVGRQGGLVHIVHDVEPPRSNGDVKVTWKCNRDFGAWNPTLLAEVGDRVPCQRCNIAADDTDQRYVYVARVTDGIKVGCSNQVGVRVHALGGELIARVPGDFVDERRVLDRIKSKPCRGREWFPACAETEILTVLREAM